MAICARDSIWNTPTVSAAWIMAKVAGSSRGIVASSSARPWWRRTRSSALRMQVSMRSEEHTSELQSRENLVCRLLLEKKNILRHFVTYDELHCFLHTQIY